MPNLSDRPKPWVFSPLEKQVRNHVVVYLKLLQAPPAFLEDCPDGISKILWCGDPIKETCYRDVVDEFERLIKERQLLDRKIDAYQRHLEACSR